MANEITKVTDQNGVDHPFKDVAAFPRSEQVVLGAKNLWPISIANLKTINTSGTWSGNTYTHSTGTSFTCTVDNAGYVTDIEANGAPSGGNSDLYLYVGIPSWLKANTDYILSGCPSGGGDMYKIQYSNWTEGAEYIKYDYGDGVTIQKITDSTTQRARILVNSGYAISGKHFKPMVRLATDTDSTYTPYAMTNIELTEKNLNYSDNNKSYSSLDDIPVGIGYATLSSGISPTGAELAGEYICFGLSKGSAVRCVAIYRYSAGELYLNHYNGSSWAGWQKFTGTAV